MERFGGQTQTEYLQQANDALLTIVQIETKEALENVGALSFKRLRKKLIGGRRSTPSPKFQGSMYYLWGLLTLGTT
jgi:hypothetical protein